MWTDERLDDLSNRMDAGFTRVDQEMRELRADMREMRQLLWRLWGSTMATILCTLVAVVVTNL